MWSKKRQLASESLILYLRDELSVDTDVIMWRNRAVIPESMLSMVLNALNEEHADIVGMGSPARYYG